jgi:hypothetical protein
VAPAGAHQDHLAIGEADLAAAWAGGRQRRRLDVVRHVDGDDFIVLAPRSELGQEDLEEIELDGRGIGRRREVRRELAAPERDLLETDQIRFRGRNLLGDRSDTRRGSARLHGREDAGHRPDELRQGLGGNGRGEVGAEIEVAHHDLDLAGAGVVLVVLAAVAGLGEHGSGEAQGCQHDEQYESLHGCPPFS